VAHVIVLIYCFNCRLVNH